MRLPKPKSKPGILLYGVTFLCIATIARVLWVLVGQNIENVSTEKGFDKLLSKHWTEIMAWLGDNGFWLSLSAAALIGAMLALWVYVIVQSPVEQSIASGNLRANKGTIFKKSLSFLPSVRAEKYESLAVRGNNTTWRIRSHFNPKMVSMHSDTDASLRVECMSLLISFQKAGFCIPTEKDMPKDNLEFINFAFTYFTIVSPLLRDAHVRQAKIEAVQITSALTQTLQSHGDIGTKMQP